MAIFEKHFADNIVGEPVKMIAEGEYVFTLQNIKVNTIDMSARHYHVVVDGKQQNSTFLMFNKTGYDFKTTIKLQLHLIL